MKKNSLFEARRKSISNETREFVSFSFEIVDRIHDILESKGLKQKDLAVLLGKSDAEISKWMRGTHNFTFNTIKSIENVLKEPIIDVVSKREPTIVMFPIPINESSMNIPLKGKHSSSNYSGFKFKLDSF